jgi:hypothetical protein
MIIVQSYHVKEIYLTAFFFIHDFSIIGLGYSDVDAEIVKHLREWGASFMKQGTPFQPNQYLKQIKDIVSLPNQTYIDLHAQILAVDDKRSLLVWDGSTIPTNDIKQMKPFPQVNIPSKYVNRHFLSASLYYVFI